MALKILFVIKQLRVSEPISIMQLSAIAKRVGHSAFLGIAAQGDVIDKVKKIHPDLVAFSGMSGEQRYFIELAGQIKRDFPKITVVFGGPHPTFFPDVINEGDFDAICIGEGDVVFEDILRQLEDNRDISGIQNLCTKQRCNPIRPLIENLDTIPFIDREIVYKGTFLGKFNLRSFYATRGCPYACTYCFNHAYNTMYRGKGSIFRRRSPEHLIEELLQVKSNYTMEFVRFFDDIFVYRTDEWLERFARLYKKKVNIPFYCSSRCNLIEEDMVKLLKEAGCQSIAMSIESGDEYIRNNVLKRGMSDRQIYKAFEITNKYNIHVLSNCMVGLPQSTIETEMKSIDMYTKCKPGFASFSIFLPLPGLELTRYCKEKKILPEDYDFSQEATGALSPLVCFSKKEKRIQKNIALLGPLAVWQPWLKGIILRLLIFLPTNFFYFLLYALTKGYLYYKRISPLKLTIDNLKIVAGGFIKWEKEVFVDSVKGLRKNKKLKYIA